MSHVGSFCRTMGFLNRCRSRMVPPEPDISNPTLEDKVRGEILTACRRSDWKLGGPRGAAARLGLKRMTLFYKMKRLGICSPARPFARLTGDRQGRSPNSRCSHEVDIIVEPPPVSANFAFRALAATTPLFRKTQRMMRVLRRNPALDSKLLYRPEARISDRDLAL